MIGQDDVLTLEPERQQLIETGDARSSPAGRHQLDVLDLFAHQGETIGDRGGDDNRRAMLIIVEDGNIKTLAQGLFNHEAIGRFDIFQINRAKGRRDGRDNLDQFVRIVFIDLDIEDIDASKLFKENRFTFHHRL